MSFKAGTSWAQIEVDVADLGRNWRAGSEANVRVGCRSDIVRRISEAVNQQLARMPRVWAWQHETCNAADQHTGCNTQQSSEPLYSFLAHDNVPNANTFIVRVVAFPRTTGANSNALSYAERQGGTNVERTTGSYGSLNAVNTWLDASYSEFAVNRGPMAAADINEHISVLDGYTIASVVVQDASLVTLDSNRHLMTRPAAAAPGKPVLAGPMAAIRTAFDTLRRNNLPVDASWSAQRNGGEWSNVAESGRYGQIVTNAVFVNLLDTNVTTRDQNTPGISCCAWRAGVGEETRPDGQTVLKNARVLASCNAASNDSGYFNVHGPCGSNAVLITSNVPVTWYNVDIALNSFINSVENSAAENKLDLFGRVSNSDNDQLRIYAVSIEGKFYSM